MHAFESYFVIGGIYTFEELHLFEKKKMHALVVGGYSWCPCGKLVVVRHRIHGALPERAIRE